MTPNCRKPPDALFAAVRMERFAAQALWWKYPHLRNTLFVVVEQNAESHKTMVFSSSPAAAKKGIREGLPLREVRKRFPQIDIRPREKQTETEWDSKLREWCYSITPVFTTASPGNRLLDVTGTPVSREAPPHHLAPVLRKKLLQEMELFQVAVGLARSPLTAEVLARKLASSKTPGMMDYCPPEKETGFLDPLECRFLPHLSGHCRMELKKVGLKTIGQVRRLEKRGLVEYFGAEGEKLYAMLHGLVLPPSSRRRKRDLYQETVLDRDVNDREELRRLMHVTVDQFCFAIKSSRKKIQRWKLRLVYTDNKSTQKSLRHPFPTQDFLEIRQRSMEAFESACTRRVSLKRIILSASHPAEDTGQLSLFDLEDEKKQQNLGEAITRIRTKAGFPAVMNGSCYRK